MADTTTGGASRKFFTRRWSSPPPAVRRSFTEAARAIAAMEREVTRNSGRVRGAGSPGLASTTPRIGRRTQRFGAFEIVRKIGEGGMGAVYLARRHEDFEQRAAIKLIKGTPAAMALMAERFRRSGRSWPAWIIPTSRACWTAASRPTASPTWRWIMWKACGSISIANRAIFRCASDCSLFRKSAPRFISRISTW